MVELYKKNIWNDQKTVNVIATACLSKTTKVSSQSAFTSVIELVLKIVFFP